MIKLSRLNALRYPADWPPQDFHVGNEPVSQEQVRQLNRLVQSASGERKLGSFLDKNRRLIALCLSWSQTGHHGAWVVPQQLVRPPQLPRLHGLKPDYLVGGKNSDGFSWYVVELKGANHSLFAGKGRDTKLSSTANAAICQILSYVSYCAEAQSYLRDTLQLKEFGVPRGLLIIGSARELEDPYRKKLRVAWNRLLGGTIEIHTYDALVRAARGEVRFRAARKSKA